MAYVKTSWNDRVVEYPTRYKDQNDTQYILTPDSGTITNVGTPVNASNMNKLESELELLDLAITYELARGGANSILLNTPTLVDGFQKNFIVSANNNGLTTTINSIPVYKPNSTNPPILVLGQSYTARYSLSTNAYYIESYADTIHTHALGDINNLTPNLSELNRVKGVTSPIQEQIDTKLKATTYTANDVLTKLKTVDGSGSGVDSDMLDGYEGSYYLNYNNFSNKPTDIDTVDGFHISASTIIPSSLPNNVIHLTYE